MDDYPVIRCSSLPRILRCPASAQAPDLDIESTSEMSAMGAAAHEFYARMVREDLDDVPDLTEMTAKHGVDQGELTMLAWGGLKIWRQLQPQVLDAAVELPLHTAHVTPSISAEGVVDAKVDFMLKGTADILSRAVSGPLVVVDWKTGYKDADYWDQLRGYASMARSNREYNEPPEEVDQVLGIVAWTRLGVHEVVPFDAAELDALGADIRRALASPFKHAPSEATCTYCPRARDCEARRALLASAGQDMLACMGGEHGGAITPARLAAIYSQSRMVKKALEAYEATLREALAAAPEGLPVEGGRLVLKDGSRKTVYWAPEILEKFMFPEAIESLRPTIGKGELEDAIAAGALRGQKGKAKAEVLETLAKAGAVEEKKYKSIAFEKG